MICTYGKCGNPKAGVMNTDMNRITATTVRGAPAVPRTTLTSEKPTPTGGRALTGLSHNNRGCRNGCNDRDSLRDSQEDVHGNSHLRNPKQHTI